MKVLVVEDNHDWRDLLGLMIKRAGYEVFEATTGLDAVDQASSVHPDLILMDLGLPGMSGDEAIGCLKTDPATRDIPVVVQTAWNAGTHTNNALEAGADERRVGGVVLAGRQVVAPAVETAVRARVAAAVLPEVVRPRLVRRHVVVDERGRPRVVVRGAGTAAPRIGAADVAPGVRRERQELLLSWLPNVEPFVLADATHLLQVQNPRGMAEGLAAFFARHPLSASS